MVRDGYSLQCNADVTKVNVLLLKEDVASSEAGNQGG